MMSCDGIYAFSTFYSGKETIILKLSQSTIDMGTFDCKVKNIVLHDLFGIESIEDCTLRFKNIFRAKRMEYNLNHLWGRMMSTSKLISQILPETIEVFHNGIFQHTVDFLF